jgi:hypothetical protein
MVFKSNKVTFKVSYKTIWRRGWSQSRSWIRSRNSDLRLCGAGADSNIFGCATLKKTQKYFVCLKSWMALWRAEGLSWILEIIHAEVERNALQFYFLELKKFRFYSIVVDPDPHGFAFFWLFSKTVLFNFVRVYGGIWLYI